MKSKEEIAKEYSKKIWDKGRSYSTPKKYSEIDFLEGWNERQGEVDKLVKCIKKIGEISTCPLVKMYSENFLHDNYPLGD